LRPLPSTGVTRLRRYYEPLRHPTRPGLSLASCQLIHTAITAGTSRVAHGPHCVHAVANTRQVGWNLFARTIPFASAFPRTLGGSAPASLFSGPAQRSLTLQPARSPSRLSDPLHQRLQQFRCLHRCSDCYRVERTSSRAGIPPLWTSAFTAHQSCPRFGHNRQSQKLKHLSGFLTWRLIPQLFQAAVVTRTAD